MAKKEKKKKDATSRPDPADVVDAVRAAVERTFQTTTGQTEGARDRGRGLLDDVASAAQRIRESFDDLKVLEDVRGLRAEVEALSRRVSELEKRATEPAAPRAAATRSTRSGGASRSAGTARKAPAKPSAARTAAATTGPKPRPAAARRKPPAGGTS